MAATMVLPTAPSVPLDLAGVGMRRKNFYVVAVDVYMAGLNLSKEGLTLAKAWKSANQGHLAGGSFLFPLSFSLFATAQG
jgi:hypothetical protein